MTPIIYIYPLGYFIGQYYVQALYNQCFLAWKLDVQLQTLLSVLYNYILHLSLYIFIYIYTHLYIYIGNKV